MFYGAIFDINREDSPNITFDAKSSNFPEIRKLFLEWAFKHKSLDAICNVYAFSSAKSLHNAEFYLTKTGKTVIDAWHSRLHITPFGVVKILEARDGSPSYITSRSLSNNHTVCCALYKMIKSKDASDFSEWAGCSIQDAEEFFEIIEHQFI